LASRDPASKVREAMDAYDRASGMRQGEYLADLVSKGDLQ
jgi:hypothetical protein